jgi:phage baseplate assembly protein W
MSGVGFGPKIPAGVSRSEGFMLTRTLAENTKQNLKNLILTAPGERVMIPEFGVGIRNFLFENADSGLTNRVEAKIVNQIETYMPALNIMDLEVRIFDDHVLEVKLRYSLSGLLSGDILNLTVDANSLT